MDAYSRTYEVRWADLDANGHVNYAAYIDATADLRYRFFTEQGFPPEKFAAMGVGPIYTALEAQFMREVLYGETVTITFTLAGLSPSGSRWKVHHDVLKLNGKKAVTLDLSGTILDMSSRRPVKPTAALLATFGHIPRHKEFVTLVDGRWGG